MTKAAARTGITDMTTSDVRKPSRISEDTREEMEKATGVADAKAQLRLLTQLLLALKLDGEQTAEIAGALIALLTAINPQDVFEGLLATQMIATHEHAMECLRRSKMEGQSLAGRDLNLKHAVKLLGLYERQLAALDKHRGKGQQKITVEHVTVEAGGQAIVGDVQLASATPTLGAQVAPPQLTDARASAALNASRLDGMPQQACIGAAWRWLTRHRISGIPGPCASLRCGAKTRSGKPCQSPAVAGKIRCRMHGGAQGSGAPKGNKNALKHGLYTREMLEQRREIAALIRASRWTLREIS